jgi:hypothetical protein
VNAMVLLAREVAIPYWRDNSWRKFSSAQELVDSIDAYMASHGLAKSAIDRLDVASHVLEMRAGAETPEQFTQDVQQGYGDEMAMRQADELMLSHQVAGMSMAEFGANRERFGLQRSVVDFLQGR